MNSINDLKKGQNRATRLRGMCKLLLESVRFHSNACLLSPPVRCGSEICHRWYWKGFYRYTTAKFNKYKFNNVIIQPCSKINFQNNKQMKFQ